MKSRMDIRTNSCSSGGYLVGAKDWLPLSPISFHFGAPGVAIGCNQLRCGECGSAVRFAQGWESHSPLDHDPAALYEAKDWTKVPGLVQGSMTLYVCRCNYLFVDLAMAMDLNSEMAVETGEDFPSWGCGGHPQFTLPGTVDGRLLETAEDVEEFVEEILAGAWKKSHPNPVQYGFPGFLLWRLYALVRETELGEKVSHRVLEALTDERPAVRAVAIAFFKVFPDAPGADRLAEIYKLNAKCFTGIPNPFSDQQDLDLHFELALQARTARTYDPAALTIIRENMVGDAPLNGERFHLLQEIDRVWLEDHRDEVLTAVPELIDSWVWMVRAWPEEILLQELHSIARQTPLSPDQLKAAVRKQLQNHPLKLERVAAQL